MSVGQFLALYERVADAPDVVDLLRRLVFDLAVRGKLVEQNPADEPASELLKRISAEKTQLLKVGRTREMSSMSFAAGSSEPHTLPKDWQWVRFGNIASFSAGRTPPRNDTSFWNTGDYAWVSIADMEDGRTVEVTRETVSEKARKAIFRSDPESPGTMIMSFKLTIGKIARLGIPAFHNEAIISIRPYVAELDPYLFKVLPDLAKGGEIKGAVKGATLNRKSLASILIPLPPLAEQRRIVAKMEELLTLLDRLESARTAREIKRKRLTAASLSRLTNTSVGTETFRAHAHFVTNNLPILTNCLDQVESVRRIVLDLAVRGRLVEQDPADEPASVLLKRIVAEQAQIVKAGKICKPKRLPPIDLEPYALPSNWRWVRIRDVTSDRGQKVPDGNFTYLDVSAIDKEAGVIASPKVLSKCEAPIRARKIVARGDVIYSCVRPYLLNVAVIDRDFDPAPIVSTAFAVLNGHDLVLPWYTWITLRSPFIVKWVEENQRGQAYPAINDKDFSLLPFPLPPLAEQRRIVKKVGEMMTLLDRLETAVTETDSARTRLLESLVRETLASGTDRMAAVE